MTEHFLTGTLRFAKDIFEKCEWTDVRMDARPCVYYKLTYEPTTQVIS